MLYEIVVEAKLEAFRPLLKKLKFRKYQKQQLIARMKQRVKVLQ
jgi:hypothetical protein